ncbi:MAG: hypothetical protein OEM00_06190, partial [Burkholderiaceae bacterium]|nr:hypothetical protein [Burkholderiaceae bacterium]
HLITLHDASIIAFALSSKPAVSLSELAYCDRTFEKTFAKHPGAGPFKVGSESNHAAGQHDEPRSERVRQFEYLLLHVLAVVVDRGIHSGARRWRDSA